MTTWTLSADLLRGRGQPFKLAVAQRPQPGATGPGRGGEFEECSGQHDEGVGVPVPGPGRRRIGLPAQPAARPFRAARSRGRAAAIAWSTMTQ